MGVDPMEFLPEEAQQRRAERDAREEREEREKSRLNAWVAVTVAVLATFLSLCNVRGGNVAQAMQEAQKQSIDNWGWYQAKKTRLEIYQGNLTQLKLQAQQAPAALRPLYQKEIAAVEARIGEQRVVNPKTGMSEMEERQKEAAKQDALYNSLGVHDDQFDLCEAFLSLAVALLAVTALTGKKPLFFLALIPTAFGMVMGLAGLFRLGLHPEFLTQFLS